MKYYRFPNNKLFAGIFLVFLLTMHLLSRTSMILYVFIDFSLSQYLMLAIFAAAVGFFLLYQRRNLKQIVTDNRMIAICVVTLLILGNMAIKRDWMFIYFSILVYLYFAIFISFFLPLKDAARYYVILMTILGIWALAGMFVLKPMVHAGILPGNPFDSVGGWHMYNFGLTFTVDRNNENAPAMRAFGIFREPGLYQIFLFVAIQLNNYVVEWKKEWKMWAVNAVLFSTLLITFATGGVLALALYIVFLFFDKGLYKNKKLRILAIAAVATGLVMLMVALMQGGTWAYELVGMVEKIIHKTDSYTDRVGSVLSNAAIFLAHPLFGEKISDVLYAVPNNTASSPILFAVFGIFGGIFHVASWVALAWDRRRSVAMNLILLVILFIPFNTQNVIHDMFFWLFPVMALVERGLPLLKSDRKG